MAYLTKQEHLNEIEILKVSLHPIEIKIMDYFLILNILPTEVEPTLIKLKDSFV